MTTLVVLLWLVFLVETFCRVDQDAWVVRPGQRHPLTRGGDVRLTGLGEFSLMPLLPRQRFFVTSTTGAVPPERVASIDAALQPLRWASGALGALLMVVLPALALRNALRPWVWPFCGAVAVVLAICVVEYHRLRRRWRIDAAPRSWTFLVSPLSLIHAPHIVSRHALDGAHPVEIVGHFLDGDRLVSALRQLWWDLPGARDAIATVVERRELVTAWERPPEPEHELIRTYCPRCHTQFVQGPTSCPDCSGVALTLFAPR
jgi:hypothetical protein